MPSFTPKGGGGVGGSRSEEGGPQRTTFRPPWVKEQPAPSPVPSAPWLRNHKESSASNPKEKPVLKKLNQVKVIPVQPISNENGRPSKIEEVKLRAVKLPPQEEKKERVMPIEVQLNPTDIMEKTKKVRMMAEEGPIRRSPPRSMLPPPPPPVMPAPPPAPAPPPPPPPPPFQQQKKPQVSKTPISAEKEAKLEALRSRPRRRPDWTDMMKEVEDGIKLKHVVCNDRSAPIIPCEKAKGQFVYESEKSNVHNQLLKQIQQGVRLKKVRTNDRSKPVLQGLRKFRRQMTIEEQIQKSASVADVVAVATEPDELDDIDKVRDDLQSTKQMLALELRNKEALERENKRLMARLLNLEAELEKEKLSKHIEQERGNIIQVRTSDDENLLSKLKEEAAESAKMAKSMEEMYHKTAEELDVTRAKLESAWLHNAQLDMELKSKRGDLIPVTKQPSRKLIASMSNTRLQDPSSEEETEEEETETETESEEDEAALHEKRISREIRFLTSKLRTLKEKRSASHREKNNLKEQFRKLYKLLKEEKKKFKVLQKEVDKMAKLMKDVDEDELENEVDNEDEDDKEDSESESESEEESEEEEEEEESEEDLPSNASSEDKIKHLNKRIKVHETRLTTLKKSNYLLKVNIDRRQDDINKQKEMILTLQEDLNSVLAELG